MPSLILLLSLRNIVRDCVSSGLVPTLPHGKEDAWLCGKVCAEALSDDRKARPEHRRYEGAPWLAVADSMAAVAHAGGWAGAVRWLHNNMLAKQRILYASGSTSAQHIRQIIVASEMMLRHLAALPSATESA